MWTVDNQTPYAAGRNWIRDKQGVHLWLVAVQGTFTIDTKGKLTIAEEQAPPALEPIFHGQPGASSLRYDSELLGVKPATDITANCSAHAPRAKATSRVEVSLRVAHIHKRLAVGGASVFFRSGPGVVGTTVPLPFVTRPIVYEAAHGGSDLVHPDPKKQRMDATNPVGCGVAADLQTLIDKPAPTISSVGGGAGPAGFGAIDRSWSPRREFAGTYDEHWEKTKKPLLADDYDPRYELCAPRDQQPNKFLQGGEAVELVNLTADGLLRFALPKVHLSFITAIRSKRVEHAGNLCSVILEPDLMRVMLVWQSALRVMPRDFEYLDDTTISELS